jgi:predicted ribosome quality control (RQC) complex YloA/Tae2 family protein
MNHRLIQQVVAELQDALRGRFFGKIYQLSPVSFAIDFGLRGEFLFVSVDPASPRVYLIHRRTKELEKQSPSLNAFGQLLRSKLSSAHVVQVSKDPLDRIVRLSFRVDEETGVVFRRLVIQLTGRTADIFLLDELNRIVGVLREQTQIRIHEPYQPPPRPVRESAAMLPIVNGPPSAQLDKHFSAIDAARAFEVKAKSVRGKLSKSIRQQNNLEKNLREDLVRHGDPEQHKRVGDLLLANIGTAVRHGNTVKINDYYSEGTPVIDLEVDEKRSLQEEAAHRFRQYTKAKRAAEEIAERLKQVNREIMELERRLARLDQIIETRDEVALDSFEKPALAPKHVPKKSSAKTEKISGVRRYLSTDGYEILVGRAARDNDNLTFRVAQPNDLWMHTGDYPGSHVVVRNPTRKEVPHRTLIEAAQLAGRFSQASADTKVVVHYTERKFLSKPKGAAPGLVRLSRFKSITVEPKEGVPRL